MMRVSKQTGFTLIEVAVVFLIIAALLSYAFFPLRAQMESANINEARSKLNEIEEALYGFAIANNRLPCPTQPGNNGVENPANPAAHCNNDPALAGYIGFVPAATLGIKGEVNCDGLLMDPWGRPYMYSVTNSQDSGSGDFVTSGSIAVAGGPTNVSPDITVCNDLGAACNAGAASTSVSNAIAVVFSMGSRDHGNSTEENENANDGTTIPSGCGAAYAIDATDEYYYMSQRVEQAGSEFDDILIWISPNILYAKLLQAGHTLQ